MTGAAGSKPGEKEFRLKEAVDAAREGDRAALDALVRALADDVYCSLCA